MKHRDLTIVSDLPSFHLQEQISTDIALSERTNQLVGLQLRLDHAHVSVILVTIN